MKRRQVRGKDLKGDVEKVWTVIIVEGTPYYLRYGTLLDQCLQGASAARRIHWETFDELQESE